MLDFPYKDCFLEGGQDKDDQKRKEIFYNEIMASGEISKMLAPKVFANAKRYTKDKVEEDISFNDKDNLIIKGNNLIALHSIKKRFAGKVKLIYIDPPYNTGNDSFNYSDRFNHSAWLTFMKNRLEVARELLADNGAIFIQCDDCESHYAKVLADDIFGRGNFVANIVWQKKYAPQNNTKWLSDDHDHILAFAKNKDVWRPNLLPRTEKMDALYKNPDNDPRGLWKPGDLSASSATEKNIYEIEIPSGRKVLPPEGRSWLFAKERYEELLSDNRIWFGSNGSSVPSYKRFLSEVRDGIAPQTLWTYQETGHNQDSKREIKALFDGKAVFGTPKPEKLIQRILQIGSNEGDIVLDFFLGSGTTAAVAHKMNRQYIGIEQMSYIEDVTTERLVKVIEGEQGGISRDVNWQGGGSFVYCELLENANTLIEAIQHATEDTIANLKTTIYSDERIIPYITEKELKTVDNDFEKLTLEDKRKALIKLVDKNKLYVNYSDLEDKTFNINTQDKDFTKSFYKES